MPFVQRVVTPIYISRGARKAPPRSTPTPPTPAGARPTGTAADDLRWPPNSLPLPVADDDPATCDRPDGPSPASATASSPANTNTSVSYSAATASTCVVAAARGVPGEAEHAHAPDGCEFDAVTNRTLSNALRQLASLVLIANDIFAELQADLVAVGERAHGMRGRVERLVRRVDAFDPRLVAVPESDLATFVQIKNHYRPQPHIQTSLFTPTSRPDNVRQLYEAAAKTPVEAIDEMARLSGQRTAAGHRGSDVFLCTPVLGQNRRRMRTNVDVEIETRMPAAIDDLRRWTSSEALGDMTVTPDCAARVESQLHATITTTAISSNPGATAVANSTANANASGSSGGGHPIGALLLHSHSLALSSIHAPSTSADADTLDAAASDGMTMTMTMTMTCDVADDMPLDHRLPSPEEQCQIIALRFPAELIRVDTSGRRFERMCHSRKSMLSVPTSRQSRRAAAASAEEAGGAAGEEAEGAAGAADGTDEIQTVAGQSVKRRSRSRKPRNKRRNTIAGTDQREIEEAAKGDADEAATVNLAANADDATGYATLDCNSPTTTAGTCSSGSMSSTTTTTAASSPLYVPRSKSSDILKRDSSAGADSTGKSHRLSHFNTLKQWGRNRLRLAMQRNSASSDIGGSSSTITAGSPPPPFCASSSQTSPTTTTSTAKVSDADDDCNVYETCIAKNKRKFLEKERRLSHERKPSYSSSEKSLACTTSASSTPSTGSSVPAAVQPVGGVSMSINPVKLRESSALRRQRRCGLGHKDELNSSSGNWSASSESGRTSIGSELTAAPKSSASSSSLNHSHLSGHSQATTMGISSGPPSSIISRRRFLNTSASSSVTSDGTMTPDMQQMGGEMPMYDDDGASSSYSCDTEGYYTSFHVDSGLKTLKEEEAPMTPLHTSSALSSTNSFGSTSNKTVLSAADEYELFGKGSTSTTASSAGTVCTTLMNHGSDRCLVVMPGQVVPTTSPSVPERKSSLTKLNRSNSTTSTTSTLERSCSSSTVGSTLERTGTIKRNGVLLKKQQAQSGGKPPVQPSQLSHSGRLESPDSGNQTSSPSVEPFASCSHETEPQSESSDFEGVERVERIRSKTAINSSRIPSLCVITPSNSDDDDNGFQSAAMQQLQTIRARHASPPRRVESLPPPKESEYAEVGKPTAAATAPTTTAHPVKPHVVGTELKRDYFKRTSLLPLNTMLGRLKGVLPQLHKTKSPQKDADHDDEPIYDHAGGEYVTIADVTNNNQMKRQTSGGYYYSNDLLKQNLAAVLAGTVPPETEYVSLNELPLPSGPHSRNLLAAARTTPNMFGSSFAANRTAGSTRAEEKINRGAAKVGDEGVANATPAAMTSCGAGDAERGEPSVPDASAAEDELDDEDGTAAAAQLHRNRGARVTLDANGKVVYNSDSLRRRKGAHTTFAPGPCVKEIAAEAEAAAAAAATEDAAADGENNIVTEAAAQPATVQGDPAAVIVLSQQEIAACLTGTPKRQLHPVAVRPVISQSLHRPIAHVQHIAKSSATAVDANSSSSPSLSAGSSCKNVPIPAVPTISDSPNQSQNSITGNSNSITSTGAADSNSSSTNMMHHHHQHQQPTHHSAGYPHLSRDAPDGGPMSATLPRRPATAAVTASTATSSAAAALRLHPQFEARPAEALAAQPHIPYQRTDNAYWTLQLRKPHGVVPKAATGQPAAAEPLYSTPNKGGVRAGKEQLRSTAHGFGQYFSPIGRGAAGAGDSGFRTSTPTKAEAPATGPATPLSSLTDELRQKLHVQQQQQQQHQLSFGPMPLHLSTSTSSALTSPFAAAGSPLSSGRSTPSSHRQQLEPQQPDQGTAASASTCSDRLGTPKTTLMDFKKLLLSKAAGKTATAATKPSAVEQLRLAKAAAAGQLAMPAHPVALHPPAAATAAASVMSILDLSGSPKTFANRRMIRQGQFGAGLAGSPSKTGGGGGVGGGADGGHIGEEPLHMSSPRSAWKFANSMRAIELMATPIPEVHSEEDTSNGSAGSAVTTIERSPDAPSEAGSTVSTTSSASAASSVSAGEATMGQPSSQPEAEAKTIAEQRLDMRTNIFLQAEENNFMRGELGTKSLSRAQMAAARTQFLSGGGGLLGAGGAGGCTAGGFSAPGSPLMLASQQQQQRLAQFKNGHYTGLSPTRTMPAMFRANTEAIVDTSGEGGPTPSLETAL